MNIPPEFTVSNTHARRVIRIGGRVASIQRSDALVDAAAVRADGRSRCAARIRRIAMIDR
jgi:hypothetical protein